jgi:hypothetical protein
MRIANLGFSDRNQHKADRFRHSFQPTAEVFEGVAMAEAAEQIGQLAEGCVKRVTGADDLQIHARSPEQLGIQKIR